MHRIVYFLPYAFFDSCEKTFIGSSISGSKFAFAIIETIHIMGLTVLLGTILAVDMSLLGFGRHWSSPSELTQDLWRWTWGSLVLMISTGIPLFLSEATRMSRSTPLYYKMLFLILAVVTHLTLHRKATKPGSDTGAWWNKAAACVSLMCWFGVALAGRAIAFL
jgi:hypothetical protein